MTLTPFLKFVTIFSAVALALVSEIWVGIAPDLEALGLDGHVFNIVSIVLSRLNLAASGLLVYLGLKAPTLESPGQQ